MKEEKALEQFAWQIRCGIVEAIAAKGGGHIGGSLDLAELFAVLYGGIMHIRPEEPNWAGTIWYVPKAMQGPVHMQR